MASEVSHTGTSANSIKVMTRNTYNLQKRMSVKFLSMTTHKRLSKTDNEVKQRRDGHLIERQSLVIGRLI